MSEATEAFERIENLPNSYRSQEVWNYCYMVDCGIVERELSYADKCHNLEEKIGCPLEVLFKALDNGFMCEMFVIKEENYKDYPEKWKKWKKEYNNELQHIGNTKYLNFDLWYKIIYFSRGNTYMEVWLEDYKKTWWLKRDKSE